MQGKLSAPPPSLSDAQAWPVESAAFPDLWASAWSPAERYTLADLGTVVEYARQRGIRCD